MRRVYKTVQKVSGSPRVYRKWNEWAVGDIVIGKYVDSQEDKYNGKPCPVIELVDAFFKDNELGQEMIGKQICLNNTGMVSKAFEKIEMGTLVQVEYCGKSMIESGPYQGKESHVTKVDIVVEDGGEADVQDDDFGL